MKARVAQGGVSAILMEAIDRIGRSAVDILTLAEWFEVREVSIIAADGGKMDWQIIPFYGAIAEDQSCQTGDKTQRGQMGLLRSPGGA